MFNNKRIKELEEKVQDLEVEIKELDRKIDRQNYIIINPKPYYQSLGYLCTYTTEETRVPIEYVLKFLLKELGYELKYKCKPKKVTYFEKKKKKGGK